MFLLDCEQVAEQLANAGIGCLLLRALVEAARLELHDLDLLADRIDAERPRQPDGLAVDEAFDVLAADVRNVLAESRPVGFDQAGAMLRLFLAHLVEHPGGGRIAFAKPIGEVRVDPSVFFLERDCQREDLALRQVFEIASHTSGEPDGSCRDYRSISSADWAR